MICFSNCNSIFMVICFYLRSFEKFFKVKKRKAIPWKAWTGPEGFQEVEAPRLQDSRHMKAVMLSALRTGRLYPPGNIPGTHFCWRLSRPQGHSAAGRIMSTKNSSDTIGNRTRDLPACSAVVQPPAPPRAPFWSKVSKQFIECSVSQ